MADYSVWCLAFLALFVASTVGTDRERIYKVTDPSSIKLPLNDETQLTCEMNEIPDRYQWRHYPMQRSQVSNPHAVLDLTRTDYVDLPPHAYTNEKKRSVLTIKMMNESMAGDYQCLAHYGALVIASIPDRITMTTLDRFPPQNTTFITTTRGNTILWKCNKPYSNPPAYIDYMHNKKIVNPLSPHLPTTSLILANIEEKDSGVYKCKATNVYQYMNEISDFSLHLKVVNYGPDELPRFLSKPQSSYVANKGEKVFLECQMFGTPVPTVHWMHPNGDSLRNSSRFQILPGGLLITNVTRSDQGVYICKHTNREGTVSHTISLIYNEAPVITEGPKSIQYKEGEHLNLSCKVSGIPEPKITWLLNGKTVLRDKHIEVNGNKIAFMPFEKRHAGVVQCFATNVMGTTYSSGDLHVIPKQISSMDSLDVSTLQPHQMHKHRRKHKSKKQHKGTSEMIPPSAPTVSRLTDESVVVRWTVPENDGLQITFFKVQYRELGPAHNGSVVKRPSRWKTTNSDIAPNIRSFEVNNLKADYFYKFRIAAVYSNNDNKLSPKSEKFLLKREGFYAKNPLPIPNFTFTETINCTSIRIYWEYEPNPNVTVDGFLISYNSASSAGDYMKATADGAATSSYVITHLVPDTVYDIKLQSFNSKSASEFSPILKQKTAKLATEAPSTTTGRTKEINGVQAKSKLYWSIGVGVAILALVLSFIVCLILCIWKQNKETEKTSREDRHDKPVVEEINHHIQADANDYVSNPKNMSRTNGCSISTNRMTITANPLADAENKSQNMIEMSCLSSQNNNCTPSGSSEGSPRLQRTEAKVKVLHSKSGQHKHNREYKKRKRNNIDLQTAPPPIDNYV